MKDYLKKSFLFLAVIVIFSACDEDSSSTSTTSTTTTTETGKYNIVDTNQTTCYDSSSGSTSTCTGTGYDADYSGNQPNYTLNSANTIVTDNITGLMWTQSTDIDGDSDYEDTGDKKTQSDAITYCSDLSLGGYSDWRLPDIKTLYSLILFSGEDPSSYEGTSTSGLNTFISSHFTRAFGDQNNSERLIDAQYATSTDYVYNVMNGTSAMFGVNFVDGRIKGYSETNSFYVLCVRDNEYYGLNNYTDNGDNTISDAATSLMWHQNDQQSSDFDDAISKCESDTTAGYTNWRLPNIKELHSIVDYTRSPDTTTSAAIDSTFNATSFTNEEGETDWGYYWASTTHVSTDSNASSTNGSVGAYVSFGRALGYMSSSILDVHGAGAQRSNNKITENATGASSGTDSNGGTYYYKGPQGDILRIDNMLRCVRSI